MFRFSSYDAVNLFWGFDTPHKIKRRKNLLGLDFIVHMFGFIKEHYSIIHHVRVLLVCDTMKYGYFRNGILL